MRHCLLRGPKLTLPDTCVFSLQLLFLLNFREDKLVPRAFPWEEYAKVHSPSLFISALLLLLNFAYDCFFIIIFFLS